MYIEMNIALRPENKEERIKDKSFHLKRYRLKRSVDALNRIAMKVALGEVYLEE